MTDPTPSEIELYAHELVHEGARSCAEDDLNEGDNPLSYGEWREARRLALAMAKAIEQHPDEFLAWFKQVTA